MDIKPRELTPQQVGIMRDFGQLVIDELELMLQSSTDSLTGAVSRRAFNTAANREITRAQRNGTELRCALIDIDHFKSINDTVYKAKSDGRNRTVCFTDDMRPLKIVA